MAVIKGEDDCLLDDSIDATTELTFASAATSASAESSTLSVATSSSFATSAASSSSMAQTSMTAPPNVNYPDCSDINYQLTVKIEPTPSSSASSSAPNPTTRCLLCPRHFESGGKDDYRRHLLQHLQAQEDETVCPICPFASVDTKTLIEHFMFTHGNFDKFCCTHFECDRKFWIERDYRRHLKNHGIVL